MEHSPPDPDPPERLPEPSKLEPVYHENKIQMEKSDHEKRPWERIPEDGFVEHKKLVVKVF